MTRPRSSTPRSLFDRLLAPQAQEAGGVGETMAQKVSILDGEVNRNWHLKDSNGEKHLLSLFHDCVTGARAAMLDYEVSVKRFLGEHRKSWCSPVGLGCGVGTCTT